jgi:hypothetical protein
MSNATYVNSSVKFNLFPDDASYLNAFNLKNKDTLSSLKKPHLTTVPNSVTTQAVLKAKAWFLTRWSMSQPVDDLQYLALCTANKNKQKNKMPVEKKSGFFCDFYLFLSLPNQELKINKNHRKIQIFFPAGILFFCLFLSAVPNLSVGVITDHPQVNSWTTLVFEGCL